MDLVLFICGIASEQRPVVNLLPNDSIDTNSYLVRRYKLLAASSALKYDSCDLAYYIQSHLIPFINGTGLGASPLRVVQLPLVVSGCMRVWMVHGGEGAHVFRRIELRGYCETGHKCIDTWL